MDGKAKERQAAAALIAMSLLLVGVCVAMVAGGTAEHLEELAGLITLLAGLIITPYAWAQHRRIRGG